jgi:hypothetical protein
VTSTGARALGVGALAPALGAAAHVEAGGGLPELTGPVLLVAFLTAGLAAAAVRRRVGVLRLAVVLGVGQVGWHLAMGPGSAHAGHAMDHAATPAVPSAGMVAAHGVVTVLVALGAAVTDRAVATMLARRVDRVLALLAPYPGPPSVWRPGRIRPVAVVPAAVTLLRSRPLRGPPGCPAVA